MNVGIHFKEFDILVSFNTNFRQTTRIYITFIAGALLETTLFWSQSYKDFTA